jgi:hypothetical protein
MSSLDTAQRTAGPIFKVPAHAMAGAQMAAPEQFGLDPMSFYVLARGAVLGPVGPELIAASFVWVHPDLIASSHATAVAKITVDQAAGFWCDSLYGWARATLRDFGGSDQLAELLSRVVESADSAQSPIFAGWRAVGAPTDSAAAIIHHLYALRELRNSLHACAVLAAGLSPGEAVGIRTPWLAEMFGWPAPTGVGDVSAWEAAERATDVAMSRTFGILGADAQHELGDRLDALLAHTGALWTDDPESPATVPQPVAGAASSA